MKTVTNEIVTASVEFYTSQTDLKVKIFQARWSKLFIVYVVNDAISYNCSSAIMQHFVVKKCLILKHDMVQFTSGALN